MRDQSEIGDDLARLAGALESLELGPDATSWAAERDRLAGMIRSYLIPRAADRTAPMTVVVAGPTGSGKSTLVNSVTGEDVSRTGALRPTTRSPVVVSSPGAAAHYESIGGVRCEVVTVDAPVLDSLVLVDAPDVDSTAPGHRAMAETLIDNADVVIFVTSALRYADDVPWQVLRRAVSRGAPVLNVLNRVGSASGGAKVDFRSRLSAAGMDDELITVPEHHLADNSQRVPAVAVRALRGRLEDLVDDREALQGRVFDRVLRSTVVDATGLVGSMSEFTHEVDRLAVEISVHLADRVASLDLADSTCGLAPDPPSRRSRLALSLWRRRARQEGTATAEETEGKLVERIVSIVHGDLRRWMAHERAALLERNLDPASLTAEVLDIARSELEGWIGFVARVAADFDSNQVWLGERVLLEASTTSQEVPAVSLVFGDEGAVLVDRAQRELWGRLEHTYARVADVVVDAIRRRCGYIEDDELRASLGAVTSYLAPAYA